MHKKVPFSSSEVSDCSWSLTSTWKEQAIGHNYDKETTCNKAAHIKRQID